MNGIYKISCKKNCGMNNEINYVTLIFKDNIKSCENMFNDLYNIIEIDLSDFDFSEVTNLSSMFKNCYNLKKIDFGNKKITSIVDMKELFYKCSSLESINLSSFDTS